MNYQITPNLAIDTERQQWVCTECGQSLVESTKNYKFGCLVYSRDLSTLYRPLVDGKYSFAPNNQWVRLLEFYCPTCGTLIETEVLPPGHPITHDIELDLDALANERGDCGEVN